MVFSEDIEIPISRFGDDFAGAPCSQNTHAKIETRFQKSSTQSKPSSSPRNPINPTNRRLFWGPQSESVTRIGETTYHAVAIRLDPQKEEFGSGIINPLLKHSRFSKSCRTANRFIPRSRRGSSDKVVRIHTQVFPMTS